MTQLQQRIEGTNYLNAERLKLLKAIQNDLKTMEGQKVQLSTGERAKKWTLKSDTTKKETVINGEKVYLSFSWYYDLSHSFVTLKMKVCINGGSYDVRPSTAFCQYIESSDYIARLENQCLKDTDDIDQCIENAQNEVENPLNEVIFNEQLKEYKQAKEVLERIKETVHYKLKDYLPKY